jgi:hypothetical protein
VILLGCIAFAIWGWTDVRLRGTVDPADMGIHKTDFTVYTEAGAAFFDGRDPYRVTNPRGWGYLYPPPFAIVVAPLHALPPQAQVLVWFALSLWMCWGCYGELVRIGRLLMPGAPERGIFGAIPSWIGWAGVISALLPALNCLQRGQVGILKLYLLLLGLRLMLGAGTVVQSVLAGMMLALPVVLKVTPIVPVALVLMQLGIAAWTSGSGEQRSRAGVVVLATVWGLAFWMLIAPSLVIGPRANAHHLGTWWNSVVMRAERFDLGFAGDSTSIRNQSLANAVRRMGNWIDYAFAGGKYDDAVDYGRGLIMEAPIVAHIVMAIRLAAAGLLVVVGFRAGRSQSGLMQSAAFGLACLATFILSPVARGHYYVLCLPATAFVCLWLENEGRKRWARAMGISLCALVLTHYVLLDFAGRIGVLGIGATLWFAVAALLMLRPTKARVESSASAPQNARSSRPSLAA